MSYGRQLNHFLLLTRGEQETAIRRLAASGMNDYAIASATRLTVEQVRRILAATAELVRA
jgi:hypothetical protein